MRAFNWNEMEPHFKNGRTIRVVAGDALTVMRHTIHAGTQLSGMHSHPNEQISIVLEGRARFTCEGETVELGPGGIAVIPAGAEHKAESVDGSEFALEEIFTPGREDLNGMSPTP
ncbi:MAG: cupin domain-containing protein [bacterium]